MEPSDRPGTIRHAVRALLVAACAALVAVLGLHRIEDTPPGMFIDEVAIALTARSLLETGEDLAGNRLPLFPLSFPDREKPMPVNPVFTYSAVPFASGGPDPLRARLPAVLWLWAAGVGAGLCAFELTRRWEVALAIGTTSSLGPWLFVLGRVGWEAVSLAALTAFAFCLFVRGARTGRARNLAASGALFGVSAYAYSTARLVAPLTAAVAGLILLRGEGGLRRASAFLVPFSACMLPLGLHLLLHPGVLTWRAESLAIWKGAGPLEILETFGASYAGYLSPRFLFLAGDSNLRHGTGRGVLLWLWAPLLALGVWRAWRRRREPAVLCLLAGLLIAPIGAAVIRSEGPHAIRSVGAFVFWAGLAALGLEALLGWTPRSGAAILAFSAAAALELGPFMNDYFGAFRTRSYLAYDGDLGDALRKAFEVRRGRPLFVPEDLVLDPRHSVFAPYWGELPIRAWREGGAGTAGIHIWKGAAPPDSVILIDASTPRAPRGAIPIHPGPRDPPSRYILVEVPSG